VIEVESTHEPVPPGPGRAAERPPGGHWRRRTESACTA